MATGVLLNIIGAVALLLWGLRMVRTGVNRAFGARLRQVVMNGTNNRMMAFGTGLGITAILQSSTAAALIVASFAGHGFIKAGSALAVMLGADIGSTLVAQIFSFRIDWASPLLIFCGVVAFFSSERSSRRAIGRILIGLGLMLLSIQLIVMSSAPLRDSPALSVLLSPLVSEPILALFFAAVLTWLAHSSVAIVLLVMSMASVQAIPLELGLVLVLGANIGGTLTPIIATFGAPVAARVVPIGNFVMRLTGVIVMMFLVPYAQPYLALLQDDAARMLVNFHTGFNILLALAFLPFVGSVARLCERFVSKPQESEDDLGPRHLDEEALDSPGVALANASRETLRMGDAIENMLKNSFEVFKNNDAKKQKEVEAADDQVDRLHEAIKLYVTRLTRQELDANEGQQAVAILSFTTNLEHVGDIIDKNLMELAQKKIKNRLSFSSEGFAELEEFHQAVLGNLQLALSVFMSSDPELARRLLMQKTEVRNLEQRLTDSHFERLGAGTPESIQTSALHLDILRDLKRINGHLTSVAYPILEQKGLLAESRLVDQKRETRLKEEASTEAKPAS